MNKHSNAIEMTDFIVQIAESLIPPQCQVPALNLLTGKNRKNNTYCSPFFSALHYYIKLSNSAHPVDCFRALLSKGLGYGIIGGSLLVKVPQITKILNNRSAAGLNVFAVLIDLVAITFNLSYSYVSGFPFSAYGDGVFLALQTVLIACLCVHYGGSTARAIGLLMLYGSLCVTLMGGLTPLAILRQMQVLNIPILLVGKGAQALTNYRNGSTGQLSAVTCAMLFFGSLARIFTSYQETGDSMLILTYVISTSANAVIVAQLLWYWNVGAEKKSKKGAAAPAAGDAVKKTKVKSKKAD